MYVARFVPLFLVLLAVALLLTACGKGGGGY
jgi:predicted small secreted protein